MILQFKKLQLCLEGSELASYRLEYYKTYETLFQHPPQKLQDLLDIKEDVEVLDREYQDLFIRPGNKYVFSLIFDSIKGKERRKNIKHFLIMRMENPHDQFLSRLNYMHSLIKKEKRQWQKKNQTIAMNFLHQEQKFLQDQLDWLPELCAVIIRNTKSQFYEEVALNFTNFFNLEKALLERILLERVNIFN